MKTFTTRYVATYGHLSIGSKCTLQLDTGGAAIGYGVGTTLRTASRRAFSEAWERHVMSNMACFDQSITSSNGFAAHWSKETALRNSLEELVERRMVLRAWSTGRGWNRSGTLDLCARAIVWKAEAQHWRINWYQIQVPAQNHRVLVLLARHKTLGAYFDSASNAPGSARKLAQGLDLYLNRIERSPSLAELPDFATPASHLAFYRNPSNLQAFDFLENTSSCETLPDERTKSPPQQSIVSNSPGMPYVARSWNNDWPQLSWGAKSGGANSWPHPLA